MNENLINTCKLFFLPASVLFTALGVAPTEGLKTGVSAIAFVISLAWFFRIWVWRELDWRDWSATLAVAGIFLIASAGSLWVHGKPFVL
jgi:hypothetical protein